MVTSQFGALLRDLESYFKCKLEPDQNNSCLIKLKTGLRVQLELDKYGDNLIIGTRLGVLPPGRYREMVFREALKANSLNSPYFGAFGYSKKSDNLIYFVIMNLRDINQDKLVNVLTPFLAKAQAWFDAITRSEVPSAAEVSSQPSSHGLFGLMH